MLIVIAFPAKENIKNRIDRVLIELFMKDLGYRVTAISTDELEKVVEFHKGEKDTMRYFLRKVDVLHSMLSATDSAQRKKIIKSHFQKYFSRRKLCCKSV